MSEILKGNFKPKHQVSVAEGRETLETRFERAALKRLGGSIAYVSKRNVEWGDDAQDAAAETAADATKEAARDEPGR